MGFYWRQFHPSMHPSIHPRPRPARQTSIHLSSPKNPAEKIGFSPEGNCVFLSFPQSSVRSLLPPLSLPDSKNRIFPGSNSNYYITPPPLSSPRFSFHPVNRCVNRRCMFVGENTLNSHHHSDNPHVCHFETLLAVGGDLLQLLQLRFVFTSHFFLYSFQTNTPLPERLGLDHYCTTA